MAICDLELKKAFVDHQHKTQELNQRVRLSEGQIVALQREIQLARLTDKEIGELPPTTNLYKSSGRMFILQSLGDTRQRLEQKQRGAREKISKIEEGVAYCKRAVKESEDSVRELVSQKKRA